ncbi:mannosyltransferase [Aphelenchoides avenae]|nr:mannosyltransferase [Aphelenchus avenae]
METLDVAGKLLFCAVDILTAYLLWKLATADAARRPKQEKEAFVSQFKLHLSLLWLFNPLTAIISSRGNADALVCAAVLASLYLLHKGEVSLLFFTVSVCMGFQIYGTKFMEEYLFYHVSRNDIRHNFSPYFYPLYLAMGDERTTAWLSRGAFIPQAACAVLFALKYHRDLPFCMFLTTFTFVALNKVCTSQYFVWYLCFLPLVCNRISLCRTRAVILAFLWFFGQACWLLPAYLLEFRGWNTFYWIWIASMFFLAINFYIVATLIASYIPPEPSTVEQAKKNE